ncbi:hypothetical protein B0J18DRAFT_425054 [Chaetomium sp. MPI-SDFR-AT-0129]|nr:hypothetical protein B0J18DRAFT_425054 [Chaetomium sp. MPI-SDFR-AT-0129]
MVGWNGALVGHLTPVGGGNNGSLGVFISFHRVALLFYSFILIFFSVLHFLYLFRLLNGK